VRGAARVTSGVADGMPTRRTLTAHNGQAHANTVALRDIGPCRTIAHSEPPLSTAAPQLKIRSSGRGVRFNSLRLHLFSLHRARSEFVGQAPPLAGRAKMWRCVPAVAYVEARFRPTCCRSLL